MDNIVRNNLHILFEGRSIDIGLQDLDVGLLSTDDQIRQAVAIYLERPAAKIGLFDVVRHEVTESITLRPAATFG